MDEGLAMNFQTPQITSPIRSNLDTEMPFGSFW
jgi:hypothetical protein